jgi:hypothetical protein
MSDHRLDRGTTPEGSLDLVGDAALLAGSVDPERPFGRSIVAAVACVGDDAVEHIADERLDHGD